MRWITKEELQRDLNELLPDKDVCGPIMLHTPIKIYFVRSFSRSVVCLLVHSFPRSFVRSFVYCINPFICFPFFSTRFSSYSSACERSSSHC